MLLHMRVRSTIVMSVTSTIATKLARLGVVCRAICFWVWKSTLSESHVGVRVFHSYITPSFCTFSNMH